MNSSLPVDRDPQDRSSSIKDEPRPGNSKSSVVVLYHEKSYGSPLLAASPKASRSEAPSRKSDRRTAAGAPNQLGQGSAKSSSYHHSSKPVESPRGCSTRQAIPAGSSARRRQLSASERREDLSINISQEQQVVRVAGTCGDYLSASDVLGRSVARRSKTARALIKPPENPIRVGEKSLNYRRAPSESSWEEKSKGPDVTATDLEAACRPTDSHIAGEIRHWRGKNQPKAHEFHEDSLSNFGHFIEQTKIGSQTQSNNTTFIAPNAGDSSPNRVFPFRATPSGNLKVIPNQVVFESKKVSVLVADPRNTKVNVKAELSRPGTDVGAGSASQRIRPPEHIDLPPGVSPSAINQLQFQGRLPKFHSVNSQTMQSQKSNSYQFESYQKPIISRAMPHQVPEIKEVPLSLLGFTGEQPIDWDNIILPEKSDLYQELARRIANYKNADCIVRIDQDEFHCHLLVLQSYSAFFDEQNCKEVDLSGSRVTSRAFSTVYDWMISAPHESCQLLQRDNILEIFAAAQHLGIKELEEQCWSFIDNEALFIEDTAFLLYQEAKRLGNTAIMELMLPRIMRFFLMLVSTKDFLDLSVDELCLLLKSNHICVNSEMEILMSAVRWLMHDWENRKKYTLDVLKCVRFGLIAPWQLVDVKRNPENPEFMELMSYPEVQKMVDDGLAFVVIKYWYGSQTEDYYHWIELLGLSEPPNRNWAGEDKHYVTYREFLEYLQEYRRTKLSEFGHYKVQRKPSPPSVPPTDSSSSTRDYARHFMHKKSFATGQSEFKTHSDPSCVQIDNYPSQAILSCLMLPPELHSAHYSHLKNKEEREEDSSTQGRMHDASTRENHNTTN